MFVFVQFAETEKRSTCSGESAFLRLAMSVEVCDRWAVWWECCLHCSAPLRSAKGKQHNAREHGDFEVC
ncbi:MAG: hypothetical protein KME18_26595 [Phormidium tanganyikae FI6-MK23]|jgi:hypothetical protein|nr:hypothetical protein [Phormidium tanganyikae FI6-MK23]